MNNDNTDLTLTPNAVAAGAVAVLLPTDYDAELHARLLRLREDARYSDALIARRAGVSNTAVSLYASGKYGAGVATLESKLRGALAMFDLETLGGVSTIETEVSAQFNRYCRAAIYASFIGLVIGDSGLGKSRSAGLYAQANPTSILLSIAEDSSSALAVRTMLFRAAGIRGTRKRIEGGALLAKKRELQDRLKGSGRLLVVDNAHRLSRPAVQLLMDLHDATGLPMILLGTEDVVEKILRDAQWSSRARLRFDLESTAAMATLVEHQVRAILNCGAAEAKKVAAEAGKLSAAPGHYRRVESALIMAGYLRQNEEYRGKSWVELFGLAQAFLPGWVEN